jgi:hypothetical protein
LRERMSTVTIGLLLASKLSVNLIGGGLVVLGLALLVATLAFWRSAVEDPAVLAPLEIMADRSFARADQAKRTEMLNDVRTEGAEPIIHHVAPTVLMREPISEPVKPFHDPFPHDDDAVDVLPPIIDPLLIQQKNKE